MNTEAILRSHGYRMTPGRKAFLSILSEGKTLDLTTLKHSFQEKSSANATTFYRTIAEFRSAGMVHVLETEKGELAMLCDCLAHSSGDDTISHAVAYCLSCGYIEESHEISKNTNIVRTFSQSDLKTCSHCAI